MKKIVSAPRLHQSTILESSPTLLSQPKSQTLLPDEPVKLTQYYKNRQEMKKSTIMQRIKSNPLFMSTEDPQAKQIRLKKNNILKNTDRLINYLTKSKVSIEEKPLSQLVKDEQLIQKLLDVFNQPDKIQKQPNTIDMTKRQFKNIVLNQDNLSKTGGFNSKPQTPKLNTSSYLNKADSVGSILKSQINSKYKRGINYQSKETKQIQNSNTVSFEGFHQLRNQNRGFNKN